MSLCGQRQRGQSRRNARLGSLESFHRLYFFSVNSVDARCHCKKRVASAEPALSVRHAELLPARALNAENPISRAKSRDRGYQYVEILIVRPALNITQNIRHKKRR